MTKLTKISVIVTTYNSGEFIRRTIDSIINQIGKDELFEMEIIVVDDCSTDNTRELVESDVIFLSTKSNSGGPNRGRNIGLVNSTGDYISITDHDDVWQENRIIRLLDFLKIYPIVTCGYLELNQFNSRSFEVVGNPNKKYIEYSVNQTFLKKLSRAKGGQNSYLGSIMYDSKYLETRPGILFSN